MVVKKTATLSSGSQMPVIGLGTSFSTDSTPPDQAEVEQTVKKALQLGYRHIDCAPVYQNEAAVGRGIEAAGVPREDLFHDPADVELALDQTLKDLGTDYVDLYLIHWPSSWVKQKPYKLFPEDENGDMVANAVPITSTWKAMEALVASGKSRSIGLSNFYKQSQIEELLSSAKIVPAVNQIQLQPYSSKKKLVAWCMSKKIHVTSWGPLTTDRDKNLNVMSDPKLNEIAQSISITATQLALSWAVQRGTSVIPKSSNPERLRLNLEFVELPVEVMGHINQLEAIP